MDMVHFIDEENIVINVDFGCGPSNVGRINWERKNVSRSFEKPKCMTSKDQHKCPYDKERTSKIFLNPYNFWDLDEADPRAPNHTPHRTSVSNEHPQTTTHEPTTDLYPLSSPLPPMASKRKGLLAALDSSKEIT